MKLLLRLLVSIIIMNIYNTKYINNKNHHHSSSYHVIKSLANILLFQSFPCFSNSCGPTVVENDFFSSSFYDALIKPHFLSANMIPSVVSTHGNTGGSTAVLMTPA